jgi:hypothetical protein
MLIPNSQIYPLSLWSIDERAAISDSEIKSDKFSMGHMTQWSSISISEIAQPPENNQIILIPSRTNVINEFIVIIIF